GQGLGGADVSMCSADPNVAGLEFMRFGPDPLVNSVADDFTLAQDATLTGIDLYGYQTFANTPDWQKLEVALWQGKPGGGGVPIGTATSVGFERMNLYRTFNGDLLGWTMQVNQIHAAFSGLPLKSGVAYWVSIQALGGGNEAMANFVMDPNE